VYGGTFAGAQHQLSFGVTVERDRLGHDARRTDRMAGYFGETSPVLAVGRFGVEGPPYARTASMWMALFAEDQIKPLQNVMITVGLRWDRETTDHDVVSEVALLEPGDDSPYGVAVTTTRVRHAYGRVSPSLHVAWDPWSTGKTKLFVGWRRYRERLFPIAPLFALEPVTLDLPLVVEDGSLLPDPAALPVVRVRRVDDDLAAPRRDEWTLGFERELAAETKVVLTIIHRALWSQPVVHAAGSAPRDGAAGPWIEFLTLASDGRATYEALVVELIRRQYRSWEMQASYTLSSLRGTSDGYEPLRIEDGPLSDGTWADRSEDRRHAIKGLVTTITPWGFNIGAAVTWRSGLPYSVLEQDIVAGSADIPAYWPQQSYVGGRRNDRRNESVWNVDARISKEMNFGRRYNIGIAIEIYNLLNGREYAVYDVDSAYGRVVNGVADAERRYGRRVQIGARLAF
jgi:hypothetical protein